MGEPVVQVKSEEEPAAKKVKLESEEEVKNEEKQETDVKIEAKDVKKENGDDTTGASNGNGAVDKPAEKTAEEMGDPDLEISIVSQIEVRTKMCCITFLPIMYLS